MDGVPFVTQNPIPTGKSLRYDFPSNKAALTGCIRITALRNSCITCATDYLDAGGTGKSYHLDTGMFTVVRYDGADAKFRQPKAQAKQFIIPSE